MFYGWELQNNKANLDVWETLSKASINGMGGDAKVSFQKGWFKLCLPFQIVSSLEKGKNLIEGWFNFF
jgi:hypothetical protein